MSQVIPMHTDSPDDGPGIIRVPAPDSQPLFVVREEARAGSASWMVRGACRKTDPELFFPISLTGAAVAEIASAKAICGQCQVRRQCLAYALRAMPDGIWGGTTGEERIAIRRAVRPGAPRARP